jgi:small subunit ribosomal protein S9
MAEQDTENKTPDAPEQTTPDAPSTAVADAPAEESKPETKPKAKLPDPPADKHYFWGTGRRKKAIARVRIRPGSGKIIVNKREVDVFFTEEKDRNAVIAPLQVAHMRNSWDVWANVKGGGFTGQAGAISLGLARALSEAMPQVEHDLRDQGLLTRDARMKERKKYGLLGARRSFQFSKR